MKKNILNLIMGLTSLVLAVLCYRTKRELETFKSREKLKDINGVVVSPVAVLKSLRGTWKQERAEAMKLYLTKDKAEGKVTDDTGGWSKKILNNAISENISFEEARTNALEWLWEHGSKTSIYEKQKPFHPPKSLTSQEYLKAKAEGKRQGLQDWVYRNLIVHVKSKNLIKNSTNIAHIEIEQNKPLKDLLQLVTFE